jgi:hypothetical protein
LRCLRDPGTPSPAPRRLRQRGRVGRRDRSVLRGWNQRCQPFTWTKDADQILTKVNSGNTTATSDHYEVVSAALSVDPPG